MKSVNHTPGKNDRFIIGADAISYLSAVKYPMIMVDKITDYQSDPLSLVAERYVSANEPAFVGHFPNLKLWPGIYTLEGLRQSCHLLIMLNELEKADLLKGLQELHKRQILRPQIDHKLCEKVLDYLKTCKISDPDLFSLNIKLLEPVFAGSLIQYHVYKDEPESFHFTVEAMVDERIIAKGIIKQDFGACNQF
jgi:3-hydroxymyristoyl/3-hydroxydecanoyl-(acyl carrier protein) dehydratase